MRNFFKSRKLFFLARPLSRGMTLIEMILAFGIFTFMFVFITQSLKQSHRQVGKIKKNVDSAYSLFHALNLIRNDFRGISYFLDINKNFQTYFLTDDSAQALPAEREGDNPSFLPEQNEERGEEFQNSPYQIFLSPHFVFEGNSDEIKFSSYSFSPEDPSVAKWIQIRYFVQDCSFSGRDLSGSCLFRASRQVWSPQEEAYEEESEQILLFLKGLKSLSFSYSSTGADEDWKEEWLFRPLEFPLPLAVKMDLELEKASGKEPLPQSFFFSISTKYLRAWNPYSKDYPTLALWNPPKEKRPERREEENNLSKIPSLTNPLLKLPSSKTPSLKPLPSGSPALNIPPPKPSPSEKNLGISR